MAGIPAAGPPAGQDAGWTARVPAQPSHLSPAASGTPAATRLPPGSERGFILVFALIMVMGIGTMALGMVMNAKHGQITAQNYKNRIRAFYASDGMNALLSQEVLDGNARRYADTANVDGIDGEIWENIPGERVADLQSAMARPADRWITSTYLGSNFKYKPNYGVRWRGYLLPPATGPYTFTVRADDAGAFFLSSDDDPENLSRSPIAGADGSFYGWPKSGSAISKPVTLKSGKRYYFELLYKQGGAGQGFGQVAWNGPKYLVERPIPGKRLARYGTHQERWDTATVGGNTVKYALRAAGLLTYNISTEAVLGGPGDSVFRAPLNQTLSLLGDNPKPPDVMWQKVIFYDFSADGSNPEFQRGIPDFADGPVVTGMVRQKGLRHTAEDADFFGLDSIGKPLRGPAPRFNCGVERWFTRWRPGWFRTYPYAGGGGDCAEAPSGSDQAFENRVFYDSLPFRLREDLGANVYQFTRFGTADIPAFTPLEGRGFGDQGVRDMAGTPHNYAFCMELHTVFEHTSGMSFEFNGDDDVWLYINDSLVMDLGSVHRSVYASVVLDDLELTFGETYPLDFFYCERQSTGSSIDLITNLPVLQVVDKPRTSWRRDYGELD